MSDELPPHPGLDDGNRCGVQRVIEGKVWVCVRYVHDDPPQARHGQRSQQQQHGYYPRSERHYYVRRYPGTEH